MTQYVPDGEMVGEGVEVPVNDGSIEAVRDVEGGTPEEVGEQAEAEGAEADVDAGPVTPPADETPADPAADAERRLAERTEDLQRLQAEYVNYKRRVDRDRDLARTSGQEAVVADLLPVLDAIALAAQHEELTGGFKAVADELDKVATKYGLVAYGAAGDTFDPQEHDALMQMPGTADQTEPLVGEVMQRGYRLGSRIVRHARVAVAEPLN